MPTASIELAKLPEWSEIGRHLTRARRQRGLTQRELAEKCRLRQGEISAFESSRRQPTLAQITQLARSLDVPLQWFISGSSEPALQTTGDLTLEMRFWGVLDLEGAEARVPGAFRPFEQLLAQMLRGDVVSPQLVESVPYLLATVPWRSTLVLAFTRTSDDQRVGARIGWLADVARSLNRTGGLAEAEARRPALQTLARKTAGAKADRPDSLGHPATDWSVVPAVYRRWNVTYAGSLESFKKRCEVLRSLRPVRET
jgi:transcriptional regulator with XRE-family HTH domain